MAIGAMPVVAQEVVPQPGIGHGWSAGVTVGATTPLSGGAFWGNMRPAAGLEIRKTVSRAFALGIEGSWAVNTSSWRGAVHSSTAFDASYVGAYGSIDIPALFSKPGCRARKVGVGLIAGAGWGHAYQSGAVLDRNFFATKVGLDLKFCLNRALSLLIRPSFLWDMSDATTRQSSAAYSKRFSTFNFQAGLLYNFGRPISCVRPYDQAQVDELNSQINGLRSRLTSVEAQLAEATQLNDTLAARLRRAAEAKPEIVREVRVDNRLNTECDVFFNIGSYTITASQMPNVERIASYMRSHPASKVVIKGYASRDGNLDFNLRLAQQRADAVRHALISRYKISASRIQAKGQGIGDMFEEESWNRVSICTLEN